VPGRPLSLCTKERTLRQELDKCFDKTLDKTVFSAKSLKNRDLLRSDSFLRITQHEAVFFASDPCWPTLPPDEPEQL